MPAETPDWVLQRRRAIGENIRAARLHANLTQEAVALYVDVQRHNLNRIEQGHAAAKIDTLILIADAIGSRCPTSYASEPRPATGDADRGGLGVAQHVIR